MRESHEGASAWDRTFSLHQEGSQQITLLSSHYKGNTEGMNSMFLVTALAFLTSPPAMSSDPGHGPTCWASMRWILVFQKSICCGVIQPSCQNPPTFSILSWNALRRIGRAQRSLREGRCPMWIPCRRSSLRSDGGLLWGKASTLLTELAPHTSVFILWQDLKQPRLAAHSLCSWR